MIEAVRKEPVAILFVATVLAFWPTLMALPAQWNSYNEHGFIIAVLVGWLIWRDRGRMMRHSGAPVTDLLPLLAVGSMIWLAARIIDIGTIHQTLLYALVFGWSVVVFGRASLRVSAPIWATAMIAAPLGDVLVPALMRAATIATGMITRIGGVEAEVGQYTISISTGTFIVEAGCSGLNYLMVSLALGAVYAHVFVREWTTQLKVMAVAGAMALTANWIRISALVFVGEATAMQSPLISDHVLFGWIVFTVMLVPAYLTVRWIERRDGQGTSGIGRWGRDVETGPEEAWSEARTGVASRRRAARLATAMTVLGPAIFTVGSVLPRAEGTGVSEPDFGLSSGVVVRDFAGVPWTPDFHGIDRRADWVVTVPSDSVERSITASRFWFVDQRPGEELIQGVNRIAPDSALVSEQFVGAERGGARIVQESVFFADGTPRIAWSWYRVGGRETAFARNAKLLELWAWMTRSEPSQLFTLSTQCEPDSCEAAAQALRRAVGAPTG